MNGTYALAAAEGMGAPALEAERDDADVAEVIVAWQAGAEVSTRNVLAVRHLAKGAALVCGEDSGAGAPLPHAALGGGPRALVRFDGDVAVVDVPPGARAALDGFFAEPVAGAVPVRRGQRLELVLPAGPATFVVAVRVAAAGRVARLALADRVRGGGLGGIGLSALVHGLVFASLAFFVPALSENDAEAMEREQLLSMRAMLDASAERERERLTEEGGGGEAGPAAEPRPAESGARAEHDEGRMGKPHLTGDGRWRAAGDAKPDQVTLPREQELALARNFGMLGILATSAADPNAPTVPWGSALHGADAESHAGNFWGADPGDSWGSGLGLSGPGEGGGGKGEGIGVRDIGGLGRGLGPAGGGGPGGGGFGGCPPGVRCGPGLGGRHEARPFTMRMPPEIQTNGRLLPEIIQRIVRQNAGRYRACYEPALRTNPGLAGRVAVRFVIDRSGAVALANEGDSTLADPAVRACVVRAFHALSFPPPEGGTVTVTYPIYFTPE